MVVRFGVGSWVISLGKRKEKDGDFLLSLGCYDFLSAFMFGIFLIRL